MTWRRRVSGLLVVLLTCASLESVEAAAEPLSAVDKMDAAVRATSGLATQHQNLLPLKADRSGRVVVYIDGDVDAAREAVKSVGGQVSDSDRQKVRAAVPAAALEKLAGTKGVTTIRRPEIPVEMALISEGAQLSGALAWHADGKRGAGVKVGVLDTGFGRLDEVQANGELPANVTVYNGQCGPENGSSHGTSMAEVVHDMAPQAELFLACVTDSMDFDDAARWLKDQGVHVVNVSIGFPGTGRGSGLPDETQSVWSPATVVAWLRGNGIVVVAAAGNEADKHIGGTTADPENNSWMNISGASENQGFSIANGERATVSLQWDAWDRTNQDFDLFVMGNPRKPTGLNDPDLGGRYSIQAQKETEGGLAPVETVTFVNTSGAAKAYWIYVQRKDGTSTSLRYDLTIHGNASGVSHIDPARSITEPATSPYVITVGAIKPQNAAVGAVENYSSRGPTIDGRIKPDVTGFTSVSTYSWPGNTGTSVAAAHVAGAAAVYKGANPGLDPAELESLLLGSSSRPRRDNDFGHGVLNLGSPKVPQAPAGEGFTPLVASRRVLNTTTPLRNNETVTLRIPNLPDDTTAVMIDLTAIPAVTNPPVVGSASLEVFADTPTGIPALRVGRGRYATAFMTATLHPQDKVVRIKNSGVDTNLLVDLYGYYSASSAATYYPKTSPFRVLDTRTWGMPSPKLEPGETQSIRIRDAGGVPASATAVLVNVTAAEPTAETHFELHGQTSWNKSNLIAYTGEETQTLTMVPIAEDGTIRIKNVSGGSAHAIVDLVGWYAEGSGGARYVPLRHVQSVFDSSTGTQTASVPFAAGQVRGFQMTRQARVPDRAKAVALGITVDRARHLGPSPDGTRVSLMCHECGWRGHSDVSNMLDVPQDLLVKRASGAAVAPLGESGLLAVRNSDGAARVSIALSGYFVGGQLTGDAPLPAPTGHWKFDEGNGNTVADASGNGRPLSTQASWTDGRLGASGLFDGVDDHAKTASQVIRTDQSFSVSAWTYLTRSDGQHTAISQEGIRNSPFLLSYSKALDRWAFSAYLSDADDSLTTWVTASAPPRLNEWTQLTAVHDATAREMRIYVNGALDGVTTGVTLRRTDTPLMIGRYKSRAIYEGYFPGRVDEARTYDRALTDADVRRLHQGTDAQLISNWAFNEGTGTIARDSTPRADHGTLTNGASWATGKSGTAVQLDGSNDSVEMPTRAVAMMDSFTVTAWAKPSTAGLWRDVVSQGGAHRSGFVLTFEPSERKWMAVVTPADDNGSASKNAFSEHSAALNQWSHLAAVYDAAARQLRLYVNGNLTGWVDGVTTWDARGWFAVGRGLWQGNPTDYFAGAVDDVRTYQGILPDDQIRLLAAG